MTMPGQSAHGCLRYRMGRSSSCPGTARGVCEESAHPAAVFITRYLVLKYAISFVPSCACIVTAMHWFAPLGVCQF